MRINRAFKTRRRLPGLFRRLLAGILLALGSTAAMAIDEDAMKGAYIHRIMKFVEWPGEVLDSANGRLYFCVLGEERLHALTEALDQKTANNRAIEVVNMTRKDGKSCDAIFVGASEAWRLKSLLAETAGRPILTIGETDNFAEGGGMIEFIFDGNRLGFEINNGAAARAKLSISAQLLLLAKTVYK